MDGAFTFARRVGAVRVFRGDLKERYHFVLDWFGKGMAT